MVSCRYVSNDTSTIGDREFDAIGQKAVFSEQGYREAILGGAAFIPESDFNKLDLSDDELDRFGPVGMRVDPPSSFCEKVERAQSIYREICDRLSRDAEIPTVLAEISDFREPDPVVGL